MKQTINFNDETYNIEYHKVEYAHGGTAVTLTEDGYPFATLSVWHEGSPNLPEGHFYVKDWSENEGLPEACSEFVEEVGFGPHGRLFKLRD